MPIYKKGAKGAPVKKIQEQLNKAGAKPKLTVSGAYDDATIDAVKAYQKKNKLKVDGIVGDNTLAALDAKGKDPKWTVRDVARPIKQLDERLNDASKSRTDLAALMGQHMGNKDVAFAYRNFKILAEAYVKHLLRFKGKLDQIEDLRDDFSRGLKGKPHEQKLALQEAQELFKEAQKMNLIADKLRKRFDKEHDLFLEAVDNAPVAA